MAEVVVRDLEHVFARTRHLALGVREALLDDRRRVRAAPLQPLAKRLQRRRVDEDVDVADLQRIGVRQGAHVVAHLRRALHVDVEDHRVALRQDLLDRRLQRAVVVAVHLRVFDEGVVADQLLEALLRLEVVVEAVLLLAARRARRAGDRVDEVGVLLQEHVDQRRLAAAGRRGHHEEKGLCLHVRVLYHILSCR